ncbi:uncharacterized protein EV154DRAFT_535739 [Mucor mucedo]|uniref:uncharacterized protein n=1 Tax=Mucor mucedo TaxID=29922 RepID=UPI00221FD85D|nr:uncharacterized protein EV154DRAFT_535739 [Mucor mucedo]KAI7896168.1 hypothetical protein EV154DRAFT_535739 [Mucor mucedo]
MSQHMAESNRQISAMLSSTTSSTLSTSSIEIEPITFQPADEGEEINHNRLFTRTASSGNVEKVREMLSDETIRSSIDINAGDNDGTPPLIYAACFGKTEMAKLLIQYGAHIDVQDSFGWSALMWATNNGHEQLVKILMDAGASATTRSAKGRTVFDFVNTENQKLVDILAINPRDSVSSTSSLFYRTTGSVSSNSTDNDYYYHTHDESPQDAELRKKLFEDTMALANDYDNDDEENESDEENEQEREEEDIPDNAFHWDTCRPDQMFVFNSNDLDGILDRVINMVEFPLNDQQDIHVPSNVIFLSARFAHYFSSAELLYQVLEGALNRISATIKINARNIHALAFWTNNLTRLLFYLKKDSGLVVVTAQQQLQISELISEIYNMIISDTEKRLHKIIDPAMLEHEEIKVDGVDFTDEWHRFFRSRKSAEQPTSITPQSITRLLSSTLVVLRSFDVHPIIIIQALAQFFHFISCELFNRILTNKKLLCRSKAMQVRMNISHLEDWISLQRLPNHLLSYLNPIIQLLQLLQCITHLTDLAEFINTTKSFDTLNSAQVKRCILSYRYEVNEVRIPDEIEKYAMQCAEDIARHKHEHDNEEGDSKETRDTKFMLPFSVPTTHMISFGENQTDEQHIIPVISEEWLTTLDTAQP